MFCTVIAKNQFGFRVYKVLDNSKPITGMSKDLSHGRA